MAITTIVTATIAAKKRITFTGDVLAIRETATIKLYSVDSGVDIAGLILGLEKNGTLYAVCDSFTDMTTYLQGDLDLNTTELVDYFENSSGRTQKSFNMFIWDSTNENLVANDNVEVMYNPYSPEMTDPSPVESVGEVFTTAEKAKLGNIYLANCVIHFTSTDTSNRHFYWTSAKAGNVTSALEENFTIGDGADVSITAQDAATSIVMDNANFEVENLNATQRNMKLVVGSDANAQITAEGTSSIVNQDLTTDANPTFATLNLSASSNQVVLQSGGITGTITATPSATNKAWTLQNVTGTLYQSNGTDVALADGGTNNSLTANNGAIVYSDASKLALLAATATANQMLLSGSSSAPAWSTATYPATTTVNQLLYSSSANTIAGLATGNSGVLVTNGSGVPSIATDIPTAVTIGSAYVYRVGGTDVSVADGGLGKSSITENSYIKGGAGNTYAERTYSEVKTDLSLNLVENTALSTWTGSANITTLGTIASGTIGNGAVITTPTMTLGTDADGDTYYRASNKLARLAKGTANQYLSMNAGATAPEWVTLACDGLAVTSTNTASAIVQRDGSGDFAAGTITANLTGNASGSSGSCTGNSATATKSTNLIGGNGTTLLGSTPYQSGTDTTTLLSPNVTTTKKYLSQTGDGANGAAPAWDDAPVKATGAEILTATDDAKFATSKAINDAGLARWTLVASSNYTATPASTSTLTMLADLTAILKVGMPVRYTIGGVVYYGQITASAANLLTICGAPMGGDLTKLEYGSPEMVAQVDFFISGTYGNGADTDLLYNDMNVRFLWRLGKAYCVMFSGAHKTVDTGDEPKVNVQINNAQISTNDTNNGIQLSTAGTFVDNSAVAINTTNYDINRGEELEIQCTVAGGTGDAANLTVSVIFILE